ncbi:OpgC domain-containing protein, partial [Pseudomonas aeruginosa]
GPVYGIIAPRIPLIVGYLASLGRNSLAVFSMGSILSLGGQLLRFRTGGGLIVDMIVLAVGIVGLGATAWFVEWRGRKVRVAS